EDERAWELLSVTDEERRALVASHGERFASTGVALRLVREAEARIEGDAARADRFAMDALVMLRWLEKEHGGRDYPRVLLGEIEVRACCSLAQTARRRGDLAAAESQLDRAANRLGEVGVDVRALYCRVLGLTRADRGRTDEALALLARAADLLRQIGEERERAEVLERAGWLSLRDLGEPLPALDLLQAASAAFRKAEAPASAGAVQLAMAWALHQSGLPDWVVQALDLARAQVATRPPGDPERVRLEWLAAWLEANLGAAAPALPTSSRGPLSVALPFERGLPSSPRGH
ncbi:MAG TPA: tetratricopeptide repeat protein, partial [Thermoanaerobaculia bacterium]